MDNNHPEVEGNNNRIENNHPEVEGNSIKGPFTYDQTCNLSQTLLGEDIRIICLPEKRINYNKLRFQTKQRKLYFTI